MCMCMCMHMSMSMCMRMRMQMFSSACDAPCSRFLRVQNSVSAAAPQPGEVRPGGGGGCEDVMAEVDPTTVTTHVRAYWAKKKKVLDEIVLKDTLGAPLQTPLCEECSAPAIRGAP